MESKILEIMMEHGAIGIISKMIDISKKENCSSDMEIELLSVLSRARDEMEKIAEKYNI